MPKLRHNLVVSIAFTVDVASGGGSVWVCVCMCVAVATVLVGM